MAKIAWIAFIGWIGVWVATSAIIVDEELGITHQFGMNPITIDALSNPLLFGAILLAGPTFTAWWLIHVYRRKHGDLSNK